MQRLRSTLPVAMSLLALLAACGETDIPVVDEEPVASTNPALAAGLHTWTTSDGSTMPYEVGGNSGASTTIVLVHGWMSNRSFWEAQLPALAARYRTVTLDLPGHGEASNDREPWTVAAYGEDVAGLIDQLELQEVVLMGHSMGGPVSLHAANLARGKVQGVVAVDALQDAEFKFEDEQVEGMVSAFEQDFVGACESFIGRMFLEEGADAVKERVRRASCDAERAPAGVALIRSYLEIDMLALFRDAGVPVRAINASGMYPTNIEGNRSYADFDALSMDDVGHYLHMTRPEEFNGHMLDTIASIVGSP